MQSGFSSIWDQLTTFPLRAMRDGACTCAKGANCKSIGKHPAVYWKQLEAGHKCTGADGCAACFDEPVLSEGIGIATGKRSGIFVVDRDGLEAIRAFDAMGACPRTLRVRRGSDRDHLYFKQPGFRVRNSAGELGSKIDLRGDGGMVVAPGSPHKSGMVYEIADDAPVADAPRWLLEWSGLRQSRVRVYESSDVEIEALESDLGASISREWRIARARAWLATRPAAISGQSGHTVTMRTLAIAARENLLTDASMILEAISDWNNRCEPPWSGSELTHKIDEVLHQSTVPWSKTLHWHYRAALLGAA